MAHEHETVVIERRSTPPRFTLNLSTSLTIAGILITGLTAYFSSQIANANDFASDRIAITENRTNITSISKEQDQTNNALDELNKKVDTLLIDRGYDPNKVASK